MYKDKFTLDRDMTKEKSNYFYAYEESINDWD